MPSVTKECYQIYILFLKFCEVLNSNYIIWRPILLSFLWYSTIPMQQSNSSKGRCLRSETSPEMMIYLCMNWFIIKKLLNHTLIWIISTSWTSSVTHTQTDCNWSDQTMGKITKTYLQCEDWSSTVPWETEVSYSIFVVFGMGNCSVSHLYFSITNLRCVLCVHC